jgi:hypothetical protein
MFKGLEFGHQGVLPQEKLIFVLDFFAIIIGIWGLNSMQFKDRSSLPWFPSNQEILL